MSIENGGSEKCVVGAHLFLKHTVFLLKPSLVLFVLVRLHVTAEVLVNMML